MRQNLDLITRSPILQAIVAKTEEAFAEDVSLLACCGSFVTGEHDRYSDIDFYFVPKTERGTSLSFQFIIAGIGYDLFPISWERARRIAALDDPLASLVMDARLLFVSSEDDARGFEGLRWEVVGHLSDEGYCRAKAVALLSEVKNRYFDAAQVRVRIPYAEVYSILEKMLLALSLTNGTYLKKGIKNIDAEVRRFSKVPEGFLAGFHEVVRFDDPGRYFAVLGGMLTDLSDLIVPANGKAQPATPRNLAGFYEEFKSIYNKLIRACESGDYPAAVYAATEIDGEMREILAGHAGASDLPEMMPSIKARDYAGARDKCRRHELGLVELLRKEGVAVNSFEDDQAFAECFRRRT